MEEEFWLLEGRDAKGKRWIIKLDQFPFLIGRARHCLLTLSNSDISREHSCIYVVNNELFIEDCKSTNGTIVNGRQIRERFRFYENDKLSICGFEFKLIREEEEIDSGTIISFSSSLSELFSNRYKLTPRESELLSYLAKGLSTKKIASSMFISPGTAKNHILNLLKKTKTHSRLELIRNYENFSE